VTGVGVLALFLVVNASSQANPAIWQFEWPTTDFTKASVAFDTIISGGPPRDGIPSIDEPEFGPVSEAARFSKPTEPVITVEMGGEAKAYPLSILTWHEIVNDTIAGTPITVTFCPLCNSSIVFKRTVAGRVLDFGTTGKLRFSDLVMYDRQTESWWQQFTGESIVGAMTGTALDFVPVRVESFARFAARNPNGLVLKIPTAFSRPYGLNPYTGYDTATRPFLFLGDDPVDIAPLAYVVKVENEAWSLDLLRARRRIESGDFILTWEPGQNSALDARVISQGRDIGNVTVQRRENGKLVDVLHDTTFAFSFRAFNPDGVIHQ